MPPTQCHAMRHRPWPVAGNCSNAGPKSDLDRSCRYGHLEFRVDCRDAATLATSDIQSTLQYLGGSGGRLSGPHASNSEPLDGESQHRVFEGRSARQVWSACQGFRDTAGIQHAR
jgi:hypothetical protein